MQTFSTVLVPGAPWPSPYQAEFTQNQEYEMTSQKPAKPSKTTPTIDDYSTDYKPPVVVTTGPDVEAFSQFGCTIADDALPTYRALPDLKYQALFDRMRPGQCLRCQRGDVGKISQSLRKHFKRHNINAKVKSMTRYPGDSMGRVWWFAGKEV